MVGAAIAAVFAHATAVDAHERWRVVADPPRGNLPMISARVDVAEPQVLAYMDFPGAH